MKLKLTEEKVKEFSDDWAKNGEPCIRNIYGGKHRFTDRLSELVCLVNCLVTWPGFVLRLCDEWLAMFYKLGEQPGDLLEMEAEDIKKAGEKKDEELS